MDRLRRTLLPLAVALGSTVTPLLADGAPADCHEEPAVEQTSAPSPGDPGSVGEPPSPAEPAPPAASSVVPAVRPQRYEVGRHGVIELGTSRPAATRWKGAPISLSLRDAPLPEVLRTFAKVAGVNLVLDPKVQGLVTVELENVPWDQALYVILKTHGMAAEIDGRVWLVSPD